MNAKMKEAWASLKSSMAAVEACMGDEAKEDMADAEDGEESNVENAGHAEVMPKEGMSDIENKKNVVKAMMKQKGYA